MSDSMGRKNSSKIIIGVIVLIVALFVFTQYSKGAALRPLTSVQLKTVLRETGSHLGKMQEESGHYKYEYNPFTDTYSSDDSIVRQVATTYSMSELHEVFKEKHYLDRLKKTAEFWLSKSSTMERDERTLRYFPEGNSGKLGTIALFIIGTRTLKTNDPAWWNKNYGRIQEVENALLWLQKSNGGFSETISGSMTFADKERRPSSDYFDGEAMLALLKMYEQTPQQGVKDAIYRALGYFEKTYTTKYPVGLYLWAMSSMRIGNTLFKDERFVKYADLLQELREMESPPLKRPLTNNICSSLEGLGNWLLLHKDRGEKMDKQEDYFKYALSSTAQLQLKRGTTLEIKLNKLDTRLKPNSVGHGGFITSIKNPVQRIDFQQHCISAYKAGLKLGS